MPDPIKPGDANQPPAGTSPQQPTGGQPASPAPAAPKSGEPTPGAQQPGASSTPQTPKEVPIAALHEERSKRQALESEVAQLKQMVAQAQVNQFQPQPQFQQPAQQVDPRQELEALWEEDPKKAVRVEIMYAMDWRDRIDASLEAQADQLSRKYPDFNNYRSTALGQVRGLPLNQRGGQGILEAAYFMVRGQNADQIIKQHETELLEKYRRGEITAAGLMQPAGSFSSPPPDQGNQITDEQMRVAQAMGLTPEQYLSGQVIK